MHLIVRGPAGGSVLECNGCGARTTQGQYFTSELQTMQAWFSELQNYVQLYQALGGGW